MSTENPSPTPEQPTQPQPQPANTAPQPAAGPGGPAPGTPPQGPGGPKFGPGGGRGGPRPGGPRPGGGGRPFPRGDRPPNPGGAPPQLDRKEFGALKPNNRELDEMIEDELNAAMAGFAPESALAKAEDPNKDRPAAPTVPGQRKKGRIVGIHGKDVFVEVPGGRSQGVLPIQQFEGKTPKVGDEVEFDIERYDSANGLLLLTREGSAQVITDWSSVAYGMIVEARVTGTNKNKTGLLVEVNGIKAFMPVSQIDMYRVEDPDQFINQRLKCMVVEVNPSERNLILSRRALLERERQIKAEEFWKTVAEGQVLEGIVRSVKPFGAFVDLGGADGLIPVSEFSWQRVNDLSQFVKVGDKVRVMITRVDPETRKIALSVKQLTTSPWDEFAQRVKAGARVTGKVTRIADFGAFVELEPGIEGLIHVSELAPGRVRRVRDVIDEGQTVVVEVLSVDTQARRIALSLKRISNEKLAAEEAAEDAEREADRKAAEEMMANRPVNPNLRGGIGGNPIRFDAPPSE
jgi:small subunit ribosomal protein S1